MINSKKVIWILIVWVVGLGVLLMANPPKIEQSDIQTKNGVVFEPLCVEGRSIWGVKFSASYEQGEASEDYFSLPSDVLCSEQLLASLRTSGVTIHYIGNRYLGVESGELVIRSVEKEIQRQGGTSGVVFFVLSICLIISIAILIRGFGAKT